MGIFKQLTLVITIVGAWMYLNCCKEKPLPSLDPNPYWGPGDPKLDDTAIRHFKINIPDKDIEDLNKRLALPLLSSPSMENTNFTYGFNSVTLEKIAQYWSTEYKWRSREKILNYFDHFKTEIEGLNIHFMRAKPSKVPPSSKVVPLLLLHGWPGSFVEFMDIIPILTTPQEGSDVVFDVICPSIPGFAFSDAASKPGLWQTQTGQIFLKLMKRIGYNKFYVQGGDWGATLSTIMATMYPENILGMHVNMFLLSKTSRWIRFFLGSILPSGFIFPKEYDSIFYPLGSHFSDMLQETGYLHIQATKPDTVGAALSNSPAGLAAYIMEKFSTATSKAYRQLPDGGLLSKDFPIPLDRMLDDVSIYWFTRSITSSMRFYTGFPSLMSSRLDDFRTDVPAGFSVFRNDIGLDTKEIAALKYNDIIFHRLRDGGHFIAMEKPKVLASDIHNFVTIIERRGENSKSKQEL